MTPASSAQTRQFRGFLRARRRLWGGLLALAPIGAAARLLGPDSSWVGAAWLAGCAALMGPPFSYLLGFRCPRCRRTYLATGRATDFLGLGRILWSRRCGVCALPVPRAKPR